MRGKLHADGYALHVLLAQDLRFSVALKDFHDTMRIGVQKTLVAEDGMGHAYCKVHCKVRAVLACSTKCWS